MKNNSQGSLTDVFRVDYLNKVEAPEMVFQKNDFSFALLQGGYPMNEILFTFIKYLMSVFDEQFFFISYNNIGTNNQIFTFNHDLKWEDFDKKSEQEDNGLSYLLLDDYYVYGQSGFWGIYRSEYWCIDIIAYRKANTLEIEEGIASIFELSHFKSVDYILSLIVDEYRTFPKNRKMLLKFIENYLPHLVEEIISKLQIYHLD